MVERNKLKIYEGSLSMMQKVLVSVEFWRGFGFETRDLYYYQSPKPSEMREKNIERHFSVITNIGSRRIISIMRWKIPIFTKSGRSF